MAEVADAVRSILINDGPVSAVTTRVHPLTMGQNPTFPLIVYQQTGEERGFTFDGPEEYLNESNFQIDSWDDNNDYAGARSLATKVNNVLHGYSGTVAGIEIINVRLINRITHFTPETETYRVYQLYSVQWKEV